MADAQFSNIFVCRGTASRYAVALVSFVFTFAVRAELLNLVGLSFPYTTFYFAVLVSAWCGGAGPGLLTTALSALAALYFFVPPTGSWHIASVGDAIGLLLFVAMGVFLTTLLRAVQNSRRTAEQQLAHIAEEVAGRARAQAELEQHNAEKRALLDSIGDAFAAFDFDWRYTYVNDTAVQFARTPREQLLGRSVWEVFPDLVGSAFEQTARRVIADRHTSRLSFFYPPFDRWFEIDFYPSKNGLSLFCRDITDAVQLAAERDRLLSRERQQAALLNLAHDAILAITVEGRIDFWNHGAERMYGWTAAEAVGQVAHNLLRTVFPQPLADIQHTLLVDGTWAGQLTHTCRDGTEVVASSRWALRKDDAGIPSGFLEITRDISDRIRLEEQLRQAAKLESLGVLAGGIAHDFNNLLVGILGNASLGLDSMPATWRDSDGQLMKQLLSGIVSGAERAADLTRQLLAFAGKGRFLLELINISDLVREISTLVQAAIPKHVQLRLELNPDLPPIEVDSGQLQQVIMNLVINAAEAIGDHTGTVLVTTSLLEADEQYVSTLAPTTGTITCGTYVILEVHDTGSGMDEATQAKIFDPFFTTKFHGRGLGLSAVLGIVRGHNGALKLYTEPGRGTTFKVLFPAIEAAVAPRPDQLAQAEADLRGSGTVLVVDDEELVRRTAQLTLERFGYAVVLARDGQEAIEIVNRMGDQIAVVLLDLTMPVVTGEEALRSINGIQPGLAVILSSGFNEVEAVRRFTSKNLAGFIQKPYTATALAKKVKAARAEHRNESPRSSSASHMSAT